jgi:hypothetical protein
MSRVNKVDCVTATWISVSKLTVDIMTGTKTKTQNLLETKKSNFFVGIEAIDFILHERKQKFAIKVWTENIFYP